MLSLKGDGSKQDIEMEDVSNLNQQPSQALMNIDFESSESLENQVVEEDKEESDQKIQSVAPDDSSPSAPDDSSPNPKSHSRGGIGRIQSVAPDDSSPSAPDDSSPNPKSHSRGGISLTLKKGTAVGAIGAAASGTAVIGASIGLGLYGFSKSGVLAGSMAAAWQAHIGNVVAGSSFATLQSVGAMGVMGYALPVAAIGGAIVGGSYFADRGTRGLLNRRKRRKDQEGPWKPFLLLLDNFKQEQKQRRRK
eukprot:TRINITY_DN2016_c0_g1_i1.p3 TRINITY_DN2016_c0_g1~~TRINITY_DN2016_c0_g1_i1.p3  ORF type:complete len:250 (-),score=51.91 TRINITY_DN2016_c0_g1_i1:489-1238(-)